MKNQYVGDVNDYRKYGLLRLLTRGTGIRLSVCWMLTPGDDRTDGKFIEYLDKPEKWRDYDPELFGALLSLVKSDSRSVAAVEAAGILPGAQFFSDILPDDASGRDAWFSRYWDRAAGADLVFFDPDNGLEVTSKKRGNKDSSKLLYWSEVEEAAELGYSVLVYQHFRREKREPFIERMARELGERCSVAEVVALRTANVLFLLAPQGRHRERLAAVAEKVGAGWGKQIRVTGHPV